MVSRDHERFVALRGLGWAGSKVPLSSPPHTLALVRAQRFLQQAFLHLTPMLPASVSPYGDCSHLVVWNWRIQHSDPLYTTYDRVTNPCRQEAYVLDSSTAFALYRRLTCRQSVEVAARAWVEIIAATCSDLGPHTGFAQSHVCGPGLPGQYLKRLAALALSNRRPHPQTASPDASEKPRSLSARPASTPTPHPTPKSANAWVLPG